MLQANHWKWSNSTFGRAWAEEDSDPAESFDNLFRIEAVLDGAGQARAKISDANHFLYVAKANQLFYTGHGDNLHEGLRSIEAPTLIIHSADDLLFPPAAIRETAATIKSDGTPVEMVGIRGGRGHLDGVLSIGQAGAQIEAFLAR